MPKSDNNPFSGFTLIELLVTMAVVAIATIVVVFEVGVYRAKARDTTRKSDIETIRIALYEHHFNTGCFPRETDFPSCGDPLEGENEPYLLNVPCDPLEIDYEYQTKPGNCPQWFRLLTNLEISTDPSIIQAECMYGCGQNCSFNYGASSTNIRLSKGCLLYWVCTPGGSCEQYEDPTTSQCPTYSIKADFCSSIDCSNSDNRCANSSGKNVPW